MFLSSSKRIDVTNGCSPRMLFWKLSQYLNHTRRVLLRYVYNKIYKEDFSSVFPLCIKHRCLFSYCDVQVLASFYLPDSVDKPSSRQKCQAVTMQLSNLTQVMWDALRKATNDISAVYKSMVERVRLK
jgi:hypothetical protein